MEFRWKRVGLSVSLLLAISAYFWLSRTVTLSLASDHPTVGRLFIPAIQASMAGQKIAGAPALLDEKNRLITTRELLLSTLKSAQGDTLDFGFGLADTSVEVGPVTKNRLPLAPIADTLLSAQDNPLLILHTRQPAYFAQLAGRRNWLGPLAREVFAASRSLSIAVDEEAVSKKIRVTFALEFPDGAAAESALKQLTASQGDFAQLGFIAKPGYERVVRQTQLLVIRIDVESAEVAEHLPPR